MSKRQDFIHKYTYNRHTLEEEEEEEEEDQKDEEEEEEVGHYYHRCHPHRRHRHRHEGVLDRPLHDYSEKQGVKREMGNGRRE